MKKNLLFLFVAILALGFTSCKDDSENNDNPTVLKSISIKPNEVLMQANSTSRVKAVFDPIGWKGDVEWSSSDDSKFTIDKYGNITSADIESGSATITAKVGDISATASVKIQDEFDSYKFQFHPYAFGNTKVNDTATIFTFIVFSQDAFRDSEGKIDGSGAVMFMPFCTYANDKGFYPWYYLGRNADGTRNLNMTSLTYDDWTAAVESDDPSAIYGKVQMGAINEEKIKALYTIKFNQETPTDEQRIVIYGSTMEKIRGKNDSYPVATLGTASLYLDTLSYATQFKDKGEVLDGFITEFTISTNFIPQPKYKAYKAGDVLPTEYFTGLGGKTVPDDGSYPVYPVELEQPRKITYSESYRDQAHPSSAPRYISRGFKFFEMPVEIVDGKFFVSYDHYNINSATTMGVRF